MVTTVVPVAFAGVLIILQTLLSDWLTHQQLPPFVNLLVVIVTIVATSIFGVWLVGGFHAASTQIALNILTYISIMASVYFKPLLDIYLRPLHSPLQALLPASSQTVNATVPTMHNAESLPIGPPPMQRNTLYPMMDIVPRGQWTPPKTTLPPSNDDEAHGG